MKHKIKDLLLPFYFGSITDEDRTRVERELLTDSEILVDYLDLKRNIEAAELFPMSPSSQVWHRLEQKINPRKKMILSISFGAIAAMIVLSFIFILKPKSIENVQTADASEILYDSRELSISSDVL